MDAATGSVSRHRGKWTARYRWTEPNGQRREVRRTAPTRAKATQVLAEIRKKFRTAGASSLRHEKNTFVDLADYFLREYAQPPEYDDDGVKISGMRSWRTVKGHIRVLGDHLGDRQLKELTYGDLRSLREALRKSKSFKGVRRTIANVNRLMSVLRAMLNVAVGEGWILRSPFMTTGKKKPEDQLITPAAEKRREVVISPAEEERLLAACEAPRRSHLRPVLIAALDTGCRRGELLRLRWADVDLQGRVLTVVAAHTKTLKERAVPISDRLHAELTQLRATRPEEDPLVFGYTSNLDNSFRAARNAAKLAHVRFHDCRATFAQRMKQGGVSDAEVQKLLGHATFAMTYRHYLTADSGTMSAAAAVLNGRTEPAQEGTVH